MGFYLLFTINIVFYEVEAAFYFARNMSDDDSDEFMDVVKRCISLRLLHAYGGSQKRTYLAKGAFVTTEDTETTSRSNIYHNTGEGRGIWAKFTTMMPDSIYRKREHPERLYTIEDVQDYRPYLVRIDFSHLPNLHGDVLYLRY